ncbi:MAG: GNAT family N-acetyltransferase [Acidimicrobiia bacterium]
MPAHESKIQIRPANDSDSPVVLRLLEASLDWAPDALHGQFFAWKHRANPFGISPGWVAVDRACDDRVIGFRTFLRWEFEGGARIVRAVRAVDTATDPGYQGQGVFTRLTLAAIDDLREEGVGFVFNTPNEKSLPGYLKMGWEVVGHLPVAVRARSVAALPRIARARTPAEKWSLPADVGIPASEAFAEPAAVAALLSAMTPGPGLRTRRTPEFLAWRYGFEPLAYRVVLAGTELADGVVVFRIRRRGAAKEMAICDVIVPDADRRGVNRLIRRALRASGSDDAVQVGPDARGVPLPRQGPVLVWRALVEPTAPAKRDWALTLGDVELF